MNWWLLYPMIGLVIGFALVMVDAFELSNRSLMIVAVWLWPLALPFLVWHGTTVLRWKRRRGHGEGHETRR